MLFLTTVLLLFSMDHARVRPRCLRSVLRRFSTWLTEPQLAVQSWCRKLSEDHLRPAAAKCDKDAVYPARQIEILSQHGLMGARVSDQGGRCNKLDLLSFCLAVEELSRGCASSSLVLAIHNTLYASLVDKWGTEDQKTEFLKDFTNGTIGCFAYNEPSVGSDMAGIKTSVADGGDCWILNGEKGWVMSATEGRAMAVFATFDSTLRHRGIACFLVPMTADGVVVGKREQLMGIRGVLVCNVKLTDVRVPRHNMVGSREDGFTIARTQLDEARIAVAAHTVGIAQASLDTAIEYAKRRIVGDPFVKLPLAIKDRLAEMALLTESARLLTYGAAAAAAEPTSCSGALAKLVAGVNAVGASGHCLQIYGADGLSESCDAERHYRDARGTQIYGGSTDLQKLVIYDSLLKQYDAV